MFLAIPLTLLLATCPGAIGSDVDRDGIDDFCDDAYVSPFEAPAPNPGYGLRKILVAHFKFPEVSPEPFDIEETRRRMEGPQPFSVSQFFSEISFGAAKQQYDIRPWVDLPHERAWYQTNDQYGNRLVLDALAYVGAHDDLNGVDIVVLHVPPLDFGYPGVYAYTPPGLAIGDSGFRLPVAVLTLDSAFNGANSASHELGHTYGFLHSSIIVCKSWPYGIPPSLTDPFYSDRSCEIFPNQSEAILAYAGYDFMGALYGHPNAFLKWQAGWLKPSQLIEAPAGGSFTLDSYELASGGAKSVRIPYGVDAYGKPVWFWIEYRNKPAVDLEHRELRPPPVDRVLIWVNLPSVYGSSSSFDFSTTEASTPLQPDGMILPVGGKFTDPYRGFRIIRGADSEKDGVKQASVTIEASGLKFDPSLGMQMGVADVRFVRVANNGNTAVTFGTTRLAGRTPSLFRLGADSCSGATLQKGGTCSVTVLRAGTALDGGEARLDFTTNDPLWPSPAIGLSARTGVFENLLPSAPAIAAVTAGDGSVSVAFTPGSNGVGAFDHYTAVCTGGLPATGLASPLVVHGLAGGVATRCVVKTTTSRGDSEWSSPSGPVTPPLRRRRSARS